MPGSRFHPSAELGRPLSLKQGQFQEDSRAGTQKRRQLGGVFRRGLPGVVLSAVRAALGVGGHGEKEPPDCFLCLVLRRTDRGGTRAWRGGCTDCVVHRSITQDSVQMSVRGYKAAYMFNKSSAASLQGRRECFTETRGGDLGQRRDKPRREEPTGGPLRLRTAHSQPKYHADGAGSLTVLCEKPWVRDAL